MPDPSTPRGGPRPTGSASPPDDQEEEGAPSSSPSLFHKSAGKISLGVGGSPSASTLAADPSLSFSSDVSVDSPRKPLSAIASSRMRTWSSGSGTGNGSGSGIPNAKKGGASPSMAQLRARKIMTEARRARTRTNIGPRRPASSPGSDLGEADVSSIVDLGTVAPATGHLITSLHETRDDGMEDDEERDEGTVPAATTTANAATAPRLTTIRTADTKARAQRLLEQARSAKKDRTGTAAVHEAATTATAAAATATSEDGPERDDARNANAATTAAASTAPPPQRTAARPTDAAARAQSVLAHARRAKEGAAVPATTATTAPGAPPAATTTCTPPRPTTTGPKAGPSARVRSVLANARNAMAASPIVVKTVPADEDDKAKSDGGSADEEDEGSDDEPQSTPQSTAERRLGVHYPALLSQIQTAVAGNHASSLGTILGEAKKRGVPLDAVTKLYKEERRKASRGAKRDGAVGDEEDDDDEKKEDGTNLTARGTKTKAGSSPPAVPAARDGSEGPRTAEAALAAYKKRAAAKRGTGGSSETTLDNQGGKAGDVHALGRLCDRATRLCNEDDAPSDHGPPQDAAPTQAAKERGGAGSSGTAGGKSTLAKSKRVAKRVAEKKTSAGGVGTAPIAKPPSKSTTEEPSPTKASKPASKKVKKTKVPVQEQTTEDESGPGDGTTNGGGRPNDSDEADPGELNESQLSQLKTMVQKAEELREADVAPEVCIEGAMRQISLGRAGSSAENSPTNDTGVDAVDAFFSKFSIENDGGPVSKDVVPESSGGIEIMEDAQEDAQSGKSNGAKPTDDSAEEAGNAESLDRGFTQEITEESDSDSVRQDDVDDAMEAEPLIKTGRRPKEKHVPGGEGTANSSLPEHLGQWKSPWQSDGITEIRKKQCLLPHNRRLVGHTGYSNIDFYSLYEATVVQAEDEDIDHAPWEYRDVGQRFLHEKSLESRNWFGSFEMERGNDRVPNPVCRPKSLEISVTRIPEPGEWSEDWYTTWKSRRDNPNNLMAFAQDETGRISEPLPGIDTTTATVSRGRSRTVKKVVEIGSLCPVRVRGGERVSRIHPDFTSSLRQSRWRKKYLKGYMFRSD